MMFVCLTTLTGVFAAQELSAPEAIATTGSGKIERRRVESTTLHYLHGGPFRPGTLGLCEGDCDLDADCATGRCYERHADPNDVPPGCKTGAGGIVAWGDYCVSKSVLRYKGGGPFAPGTLGECEGDCDSDSDCEAGLRCWERDNSNQVPPGCLKGGNGDKGTGDYCVKATLVNRGNNGPDKHPTESRISPGDFTTFASQPLGHCEGDCDTDDDCAEGLRCFNRRSSDQVPPGCKSGGKGDIGPHDYCVYQRPYELSGMNRCAKKDNKKVMMKPTAWILVDRMKKYYQADGAVINLRSAGNRAPPLTKWAGVGIPQESDYGVTAASPFSSDLAKCSTAEDFKDDDCYKAIESREECAKACDEMTYQLSGTGRCMAFEWSKQLKTDYCTRRDRNGACIVGKTHCSVALDTVTGHWIEPFSATWKNSDTECWVNKYLIKDRQQCVSIDLVDVKMSADPTFNVNKEPEVVKSITVSVNNCGNPLTQDKTQVTIESLNKEEIRSEASFGFSDSWSNTFSSSMTEEVSVSVGTFGAFAGLASADASYSETQTRQKMNSNSRSTMDSMATAKVDWTKMNIKVPVSPRSKMLVVMTYLQQRAKLTWTGKAKCLDANGNTLEEQEVTGTWTGYRVHSISGNLDNIEISCGGFYCKDKYEDLSSTFCPHYSKRGLCSDTSNMNWFRFMNEECVKSCCINDKEFARRNPETCEGCVNLTGR